MNAGRILTSTLLAVVLFQAQAGLAAADLPRLDFTAEKATHERAVTRRAAGWAVVAAGAGVLALGIAFGVAALSFDHRLEAAPVNASRDEVRHAIALGRQDAIAADILIPTGVVSIGVGLLVVRW